MAWFGNLRIFFERIFPRKRNYLIGLVFFVIGLGFAFALTCLAVVADINSAGFWGDYLDAVKFDNSQPTQADLVKLSCPIILASGENANIATTFKNAQAKSASILVKAVVGENNSESYRVVEKTLTLSPGSSMEFSWQVDQKDIIYGNYILTRVFLMNQDHIPPYPASTESCGIYVLDLFGLPGGTLVAGMFMAGMTGLILGCVFISFSDAPIKHTWPRTDMGLYALAGILMVGMTANIFGWWILAGLLLFLSILLGAVLIFH